MAYSTKSNVSVSHRERRNDGATSRRPIRDDRPPARVGVGAFLTLSALLALPVFALTRQFQVADWRMLIGVPLVMSVLTFLAYRTDKRRARDGRWRTSESTLHTMEFLGGWPGAFLAQRRYRHKTVKVSFQLTFWTIVVFHYLIAADSLLGWRFASRLMEALNRGS